MTTKPLSIALSHWPVPVFFAVLAMAGLAYAVFLRRRDKDEAGDDGVTRGELVGWGALVVIPPLVYLAALSAAFSVEAALFTSILSATVIVWMAGLLDDYAPVLLAIVAVLLTGLAPAKVALGGFSSATLLMLLGVFSLSAVIGSSGLSSRLMLHALLRLPDKPIWQQLTIFGGGCLLSPIMPSANARLSLLVPVFRSMAEAMRLPQGGLAITGLLAATFAGGTLFAPMMATSRSANIAAISFLPKQMQSEFLGIFWLVCAAVAAVVVTGAAVLLLRWFFSERAPQTLPAGEIEKQLDALGPIKPEEKIAAGCFVFFLGGCMTVSWHGLSPAVLGGCLLVVLLFSGTIARKEFRRELDWPMVVFLLGVDSIMRIMDHLGIARAIADGTGDVFAFVGGRIELFILAALATCVVVRLFLTVTPGMLTSAVVLLPVAAANGIHPWICVFLAALFSDIWFVRYQGTTGYLQLCSLGLDKTINEPAFFRFNWSLNAVRVAAAYASIPWWKWLGLL